eukprot:gene61612-84266_t
MFLLHGSIQQSKLVQRSKSAILCVDRGRNREKRKEQPMFGYVSKIASRLRGPSIEEREMAYLNSSTDRVDLEHRQRQIDRGMFRNRTENGLNYDRTGWRQGAGLYFCLETRFVPV